MAERVRRTRLAEVRWAHGFSQERLAEAIGMEVSAVRRWERGEQCPRPGQRRALCTVLGLTPAELEALLETDEPEPSPPERDDALDALELSRLAQASDVGGGVLDELDERFDELATRYQTVPPEALLAEVRRHCAYVGELWDKRATLAERRRLHALGGWLSLLAATLHVDLRSPGPARSRLRTARLLARHAGHAELEAWTFETEAWRALTTGDHRRAADLSRAALHRAPRGSSVEIQATAQEGRARARMGERRAAYEAIDRVRNLAAGMQLTARREHHYQYDPAKASSYEATTLAWVGDPAAEAPAREVIGGAPPADATAWPRRIVTAHIDLALALLTQDRLDEACEAARTALTSGRVLPANHWRVTEILTAVESRTLPEARDLREAYETHGPRA
ncbi:helix-turn-helix domain-containing protein [Streptomyces cacaoi]|uniref:helix-turn-helix domain-containing protein n=1 Tax=Streptomyces cacaoi TaxID=1898 RepID=UPI00261A933D|nr:helix-turn-helix domain-containing protein [Streptomyces cacaoi]